MWYGLPFRLAAEKAPESVIPTLLTWPQSALIHDLKGEIGRLPRAGGNRWATSCLKLIRPTLKRRRSLSSYITHCLLDYHVEAAPVPRTSNESSPPFSALLRDTEENIAAEIEKRTSGASTQLSKQLMVLTAMLDRFVLSNLVHTREVSEANRSNAISSGERRYANWREAVKEVLDRLGAPRPRLGF